MASLQMISFMDMESTHFRTAPFTKANTRMIKDMVRENGCFLMGQREKGLSLKVKNMGSAYTKNNDGTKEKQIWTDNIK